MRECRSVEIEALEILRRCVAVVRADERLDDRRLRAVEALANLADREGIPWAAGDLDAFL